MNRKYREEEATQQKWQYIIFSGVFRYYYFLFSHSLLPLAHTHTHKFIINVIISSYGIDNVLVIQFELLPQIVHKWNEEKRIEFNKRIFNKYSIEIAMHSSINDYLYCISIESTLALQIVNHFHTCFSTIPYFLVADGCCCRCFLFILIFATAFHLSLIAAFTSTGRILFCLWSISLVSFSWNLFHSSTFYSSMEENHRYFFFSFLFFFF